MSCTESICSKLLWIFTESPSVQHRATQKTLTERGRARLARGRKELSRSLSLDAKKAELDEGVTAPGPSSRALWWKLHALSLATVCLGNGTPVFSSPRNHTQYPFLHRVLNKTMRSLSHPRVLSVWAFWGQDNRSPTHTVSNISLTSGFSKEAAQALHNLVQINSSDLSSEGDGATLSHTGQRSQGLTEAASLQALPSALFHPPSSSLPLEAKRPPRARPLGHTQLCVGTAISGHSPDVWDLQAAGE